jgi:hypothetical protein
MGLLPGPPRGPIDYPNPTHFIGQTLPSRPAAPRLAVDDAPRVHRPEARRRQRQEDELSASLVVPVLPDRSEIGALCLQRQYVLGDALVRHVTTESLGVEELLLRRSVLVNPRRLQLHDEEHVVVLDIVWKIENGRRSGETTSAHRQLRRKVGVANVSGIWREEERFELRSIPQHNLDFRLALVALLPTGPPLKCRGIEVDWEAESPDVHLEAAPGGLLDDLAERFPDLRLLRRPDSIDEELRLPDRQHAVDLAHDHIKPPVAGVRVDSPNRLKLKAD